MSTSEDRIASVAPISEELERAILGVAERATKGRSAAWKNLPHSATPGYAGRYYSGSLMIVGRATNGGLGAKLHLREIDDGSAQIHAERAVIPPSSCPLAFASQGQQTNGYNPNLSAFWRVTRAMLAPLEHAPFTERDWSCRIAWTNRCKIAPWHGGNPSDAVSQAQLAPCKEILWKEILHFRPRIIVFMAGAFWFDWFFPRSERSFFLKRQAGERWAEEYGLIDVSGQPVPFVSMCRPERRNEAIWVEEAHAALSHCHS